MPRRHPKQNPHPSTSTWWIADDERISVIRAALYLAPRYRCKEGGRWLLMSNAKFSEVKRLLGSKRSPAALRELFKKWFAGNEEKWEVMKKEALMDWEAYFAKEVELEAGLETHNEIEIVDESPSLDDRTSTTPQEPATAETDERGEPHRSVQIPRHELRQHPQPSSFHRPGELDAGAGDNIQIYCYGRVNHYHGEVKIRKRK